MLSIWVRQSFQMLQAMSVNRFLNIFQCGEKKLRFFICKWVNNYLETNHNYNALLQYMPIMYCKNERQIVIVDYPCSSFGRNLPRYAAFYRQQLDCIWIGFSSKCPGFLLPQLATITCVNRHANVCMRLQMCSKLSTLEDGCDGLAPCRESIPVFHFKIHHKIHPHQELTTD